MNCPQCQGDCWDNTQKNIEREKEGKKNLPQYTCKDKEGCGWIMWPDKKGSKTILKETGLAPKPPENKDDYFVGKRENSITICKTDLMCALITAYPGIVGSNEIINMHRLYWSEITNPLGKV